MRVLVTGANGFLGRAVVGAFLAGGHRVRAMVRPKAVLGDLPAGVEAVRADLRSPPPLEGAFAEVDALVHLAAGMRGDEHELFTSTVVGTERLLSAMSRTSVKRVVLASSVAVYDWGAADGVVTEASPLAVELDQRGAYARAKVWQERVARRLADEHGLELTVLRPGVVWGPGDAHLTSVGRALGPLQVIVGPRRPLPLTYLENCADCFLAATLECRAVGETFNVVDGEPVTAWRYFREHRRHTGAPPVPVPVPYAVGLATARAVHAAARRAFDGEPRLPAVAVPARFEADFKPAAISNAKLSDVLGWHPPYSFGEALARTYERVPPRPRP